MSDAEVLTAAIIAMLYFGGNYAQVFRMLVSQRYNPNMVGKSRFFFLTSLFIR